MLEEFVKHDPDGTCMVGRAEFWDILTELKLPIPWYHGVEDEVKPPEFAELEKIVNKHDKGKGYIDYVTFLIGKKYIPKKLQMGSFNPKFKKEKKQKKNKLKANIPICQLPPIHRPVELVPKHHIWTDFCRFDRDHVPSNAFEDDSYWYMKMPGREATDMADRVRFGDFPTVSNAVKTIRGQPNFPNKYFKTPLMMAILAADIDMVTYLLENGLVVFS